MNEATSLAIIVDEGPSPEAIKLMLKDAGIPGEIVETMDGLAFIDIDIRPHLNLREDLMDALNKVRRSMKGYPGRIRLTPRLVFDILLP